MSDKTDSKDEGVSEFDVEAAFAKLNERIDRLTPSERRTELEDDLEDAEEAAEDDEFDVHGALTDLGKRISRLERQARRKPAVRKTVPPAPTRRTTAGTAEPDGEPPKRKRRLTWFPDA